MILAKYISDLLYRYECVIIPGFGGFVTNEISARVNQFTHTFYPPSKQLTFNSHLQNNDGLLVNYVASSRGISYSKAVDYIQEEVLMWNSHLTNEELELENIGSFHLNTNGKLIFEPTTVVNYLTSSFGFNSYVSPAVKRIASQEKVIPVHTTGKTPGFIRYAAAAAIIFALGTVGLKEYQKFEYNNLVAQAEQKQQQVEKSIQEATFVISNPLPTITLNVAKEIQNYHIIAGAFRNPANAEKKLQELLQKGFNARILGVNKWNLTPVAYESFSLRNEALNSLNSVRKSDSKDAWLLVKEY